MLSRWYQGSSGPIADAAALRPSRWEGVIVMSGYTKGPLLRPLGIQRDDHVGESIHHLLVMKHTDDRARVLTRLRPQDLQDTQGEVWIEVRNRLVGKKHFRLLKERPGERRPLLFTAGDFKRAAMHMSGQAKTVESLKGFMAIRAREAG
jgi:hypothetical protein